VGLAELNLCWQGIPVVGGPTLQDIPDEYLFSAETYSGQHFRQQLAGTTHEGPTLQVLISAWGLPDEYDGGR
jgi:hypothetical protein